MKRTQVALWLVAVIMFIGCEGNLTQPDLVYPQEVQVWDHSLAKDARIVAKLDSIVPEGTVYILPEDTTTIVALGGELLPGGSRVENLKGDFYKVHLYSELKVAFDSLSIVTIAFPTNLQYLDSQDKWISLSSGGTVSAKAVKTGIFGGAILSVSAGSDYDDEDTQGVD
ncbi:MAG: hypothetical protein HQ508_00535 [Candidatus Marinimicrobia bacterium]|nr:hypothetical protein [Candidatus Neomarinimicrobiota bacterium]